MSNIQDINNIPELQSPFGQLREVDADGKEWWNSRKLARVMGYGKYWNFERVIAKAQGGEVWSLQYSCTGVDMEKYRFKLSSTPILFGFHNREWQSCLE